MEKSITSTAGVPVRDRDADGYGVFEDLIATRVAGATAGPLFTTDATGGSVYATYLYKAFIDGLPPDRRQHYNCNCCRRFVETYGGLVTIDYRGETTPVLWNLADVPNFFYEPAAMLALRVSKARVTGPFYSSEKVWGTPESPKSGWTHLHGNNPNVYSARDKTAEQLMAEKREEYRTLSRGLAEFRIDVVREAVRVLEADALDRSEKTLGVAKWLLALQEAANATKDRRRKENLVWRAVATAPPGFCHVRSTMISTLLEDIVAGKSYEAVSRAWAAKMHPTKYQRPTAVKAGNVEEAEKLVGKLGIAAALPRRFARLTELRAAWRPERVTSPQETAGGGGVFGHLKPKGGKDAPVTPLVLPPKALSWEKFADTVLPNAREIDVRVMGSPYQPFFAFTTAVDPAAPPILQWDREPRNPVAWYMYLNGSPARQWNLLPGEWVPVKAVCDRPPHWYGNGAEDFAHFSPAAFLVLEGCRDTAYKVGGLFFPETLKSELHRVRSVLEAYSAKGSLAGADEADACGLMIERGASTGGLTLRVRSAAGEERYTIDRWE